MEIIFTIKFDEDESEITLSEEQARSLYIKLEKLFNNYKTPIYSYKPNDPYTNLKTYTTANNKIDDETKVSPIKINKPKKANWSYYGNCTNSINE